MTELGAQDSVTRHAWELDRVAPVDAVTAHTVYTPEGSQVLTWADQKGREIAVPFNKRETPDSRELKVEL